MLTTVEDSTGNTEATAAAVGVAAHHHHHHHHHHQHPQHRGAIAVARHLGVEQQERSATAPIHLTTATPYHQVTIAADTNNNHDHHRNLEHHAAQRHDHWNKCKSDKRDARDRERITHKLLTANGGYGDGDGGDGGDDGGGWLR
ncbi:nuclear hormone receptor hr38 [Lasius niger]|uniref:Nuclear hormone receptor hr38 n=1 Tax=Lasius niger TaxID=67767 RepID=A0A0J7L3B4_LASNI|nr:nuclear hormone receptor hr38 [Lasius niger]